MALQGQQLLTVSASHTFAARSSLPVASRLPSGLQATLYTAPVALQTRAIPSRYRVPHLRRLVRARGGQPLAVRAPGHAVTPSLWPFRVSNSLSVLRPTPSPYYPPSRRQPLPVRAPGHARQRCRRGRVRVSNSLPVAGVPHFGRVVIAPRRQPLPSGLQATLEQSPPWPLRVSTSFPWPRPTPSRSCHSSRSPAACRPGSRPRSNTASSWPLRVSSSLPVAASHTFAVLSISGHSRRQPLAVRAPGHAPNRSHCGRSGSAASLPVVASHTFAVSSELAVASRLPSGLQATLFT